MLISETHFTDKSYLKLSKYTVYHRNYPAGTGRGGTDVIIVLNCIYFGSRNPEDIEEVNVQQYKPQNN
jgi:hypothetical protein